MWGLAELYGYVVQFEPYQGVKRRKLVASSTKWGLKILCFETNRMLTSNC